jgi:signal transduction histidine kinase
MSDAPNLRGKPGRPGPIAFIAIYLVILVNLIMTATSPSVRDPLSRYPVLFLLFIALFTVVLWRPNLPEALLRLYMVEQSGIVLGLLSLNPNLDFHTRLFILLSYQAALVFRGRERRLWVAALVLLTGVSLVAFQGLFTGLAQGLLPMAVAIVLPAFVVANEETETARARSQAMLLELQASQRQLQSYAGQVEELAAMEERARLARELHDSVSQTIFSILLNTRSTQMLLEREPQRVRGQLEQLQALSQNVLTEMRSLISQLRPSAD